MENNLKILFDFQKFEKNGRLEKLISETESRYAKGLSDEELEFVNAAGVPNSAASQNTNGTDNRYDIQILSPGVEPGNILGVKPTGKYPQK